MSSAPSQSSRPGSGSATPSGPTTVDIYRPLAKAVSVSRGCGVRCAVCSAVSRRSLKALRPNFGTGFHLLSVPFISLLSTVVFLRSDPPFTLAHQQSNFSPPQPTTLFQPIACPLTSLIPAPDPANARSVLSPLSSPHPLPPRPLPSHPSQPSWDWTNNPTPVYPANTSCSLALMLGPRSSSRAKSGIEGIPPRGPKRGRNIRRERISGESWE